MTNPTQMRTEKFQNIDIRMVYDETNGQWVIPIADIASAIQMDRGNLTRLLNSNPRFFDSYRGIVRIDTPGGYQSLVSLPKDGIMGVLFTKMLRTKDKELQDRIIRFQKWVSETLVRSESGLYIHGVEQKPSVKPVAAMSPDTLDIINTNLDIAELAITRSGVPKEIAHGYAWALAGEQTGMELNVYASFIKNQMPAGVTGTGVPGVPALTDGSNSKESEPETGLSDQADYERHFSITKVAEILKQSVDKVRNTLETVGIIYYENGIWHLTKRGEQFGKNFMVMPGYPYSSQKRSYIKYNPDAITVLRAYFGDDKQVQKPLIE